MVVDRRGKSKVLASGFSSCQGLTWRPDGKEVWFSAARTGGTAEIYAARLTGGVRTVLESPGGMRITDIAPDGRVLFIRDNHGPRCTRWGLARARSASSPWGIGPCSPI